MIDAHRVRRWRWQARAPDTAAALALRRTLREQHEACELALERAGAAIVPAGEVWHVPRLAISIRLAEPAEIGTARFAERVEAALRVALAELVPPTPHAGTARAARAVDPTPQPFAALPQAQRHTRAVEARQALRHYLATGMLPWTLAGLAREAAQEILAEAAVAAAAAALRGELQPRDLLPDGDDGERVGALLRWLPLLPAAMRRSWVATHPYDPSLPADVAAAWRHWVDSEAVDRLRWQALWLALPLAPTTLRRHLTALRAAGRAAQRAVPRLAEAPFAGALLAAVDDGGATFPAAPAGPAPGAGTPAADAGERQALRAARAPTIAATAAWLVPLAGLVLLHPWLPRLLGACGVLDADGGRIDPGSLARACALLHALACGDAGAPEHDLPFVKLLLGRRPDEPLALGLPQLAGADRAEIDALLAALREHWSALRGTTVEGLRLSFLQRRGLLERADGGWQLRMQGEPFDLLLATLPWSIGFVRLPWMPQPLTVQWPTPA